MQENQVRINTIPSRALEVWRRLYQRYSLEPLPASVVPDVSKTIVPTTDADALLLENGRLAQTSVFGAGAATFETIFTVDSDVREHIAVISILRTVGDNDWDQVLLRDDSRNGSITIAFDAAQTAQAIFLPVIMEARDNIRILLGGTGVAATTVVCSVWSGEEAAF